MTGQNTHETFKQAYPVADVVVEDKEQSNIQKFPRLPCRGCLASCKNYEHCDGKLWRMSE